MNTHGAVAALLQDCERSLATLLSAKADIHEEEEQEYQRHQALLPDDLRTLLEEAKGMKWPFVPEKWQYKQDLGPEDKTNLQDTIGARLPDLLVYLKASIMVKDCVTAAAIVFLIDRFLYWIDASSKLLKIAKGLHKLQPTTPIGPQVVIRQARLAVNAGKLLKAEYILSSLINDNGATGTWQYAKESDRILVQSVCLQIRGQILQKLGMWYEAAELIWASIVGYFKLPQADKKGIATSLGILADIFSSMNEKDYVRFKTNAAINLTLLQESSHRLLSAAEACKLAAVYSQYTPLFVLTAVNIRGVCLLSYSHSKDCPPERRKFYLSEAKESFEIGLLTKNDSSHVTSKQELHSFIKAAFCLTTVHRWLYGESEKLCEVDQLCREAIAKLHTYSTSFTEEEEEEKGVLAEEIMSLITSVKKLLQVETFRNSDARSYVPDSYKGAVKKPVLQGEANFEKILAMNSQHHLSVCEVFKNPCRIKENTLGETHVGACITTLKTETKNTDTTCTTDDTAYQRKGAGKMFSTPKVESSSEKLSGQTRNKQSSSDVRNISIEKGTESVKRVIIDENSVFSRWQNRSQTTSSENAWCKLSLSSYSSSWEELNCNSNKESPNGGQQQEKGSVEEQCCTTETDENGQAAYMNSLSPRTQYTSLRELPYGCLRSPQPFLGVDTALARRPGEKASPEGAKLRKGENSSEGKTETNNTDLKNNSVPSLTAPSYPARMEEEECSSSSWAELEPWVMAARPMGAGCSTTDSARVGHLLSGVAAPPPQNSCVGRDPGGGTVDSTERPSPERSPPTSSAAAAGSTGSEPKPDGSSFVSEWLRKPAATVGRRSLEVLEVDPQAETVDDTEFDFISTGELVNGSLRATAPELLVAPGAATGLPLRGNKSVTKHFECASTEEEEEEKPQSNKRLFSSSLRPWHSSDPMPGSSPESPFLSLRGSGLVFTPGRTKEEILDARILRDDDYMQLLAGVEHNWLVQRLMPTGMFKSKQLHKAYSALLLKYSKKSGLWTGQETSVFIGDYLNVAKEGKQRNAFWIHFLHQEESLGRYVGKEYKEEKGLLHHFSDVERQMTAQYYVTEFNKRLYEQKVPTQIFYIPSAVLLILEDRTIKGCVSVEPYILGEFVKLSNNTKVVKNEYKATEYGLAYGHFSYEFSNGTEVVVDLQGWVTGNGKGLIYLTDPQIHSLNSKDVSRSNFGKRGIYYFFNNQHVECNEICHCLSLTRPSVETPM
ncbi:alpha-protein kinase 1 isoform X1 [Tympanuchus pallidicinctus]|uniref:alpha-protein kinase 1 isoform X1 n=3 Tax=Tympanuchus pallidicinctus TaxID=109042 RepID=UPI002286D1D3|nr:alpha-protein kinase 1 isoform X1 [Tympanuchus pallidicinctus]XP_052538371.1 alpha-protein kinase 1 isoform X1 [Tympanuchus pallidicinctus]